MSKTITKKSFGKETKVNVSFTDNSRLIWVDDKGNIITGLPKKAFVSEEDTKETRAEFFLYKAALSAQASIKLEKSLAESMANTAAFSEQADMILSGDEEKLKLAKEEEKLLAKLAKIKSQQSEL
tara:strand:+ start:35 stop:409 length:375 start_codon:yes stop_codon:yes gene_type:complete